MEPSYVAGGDVKQYIQLLRKTVNIVLIYFITLEIATLAVSYTVKHTLSGIYPREMQTYVHINNCRWMFMVTLFIIAQN